MQGLLLMKSPAVFPQGFDVTEAGVAAAWDLALPGWEGAEHVCLQADPTGISAVGVMPRCGTINAPCPLELDLASTSHQLRVTLLSGSCACIISTWHR